MKKQLIGIAALAAAIIIAAIFGLAPQSNVTLNAATIENLGIDILGLTKTARDLPDHQYPTH